LRRRHLAAGLAGVGVIILGAMLAAAQPAQVARLVGRASAAGVGLALLWTAALMIVRGVRLSLLLSPRLPVDRSVAVVSFVQLCVGVLPFRLGELSFLPALELAGVRGAVHGLSMLVVLRVADLASLLLWAVGTALFFGRGVALAAAGLTVVVALVATGILVAERTLRRLIAGRRRIVGWRRRRLLELLRVRRELRRALGAPARVAGIAICSVALWPLIWLVTLELLHAMQIGWPAGSVLLAVTGASLGTMLPFNVVGSFGSQEAGWTAVLAAVGVRPADALAAGFASHLWGLLLAGGCGGAGLAYLVVKAPPSSRNVFRQILSALTSRRRDP
jgi:hypothetical protein